VTLIHNERQKLLAANLDRLSSAFAIIGVVTPVIAWSHGFPTAPPWTLASVVLSGIWLSDGGRPTFPGEANLAEASRMTWMDIYVIFGIPAIVLTLAYGAVRLNEWDLDRRHPPGE